MLLVFGVLWWMYGGYVWLGNARTPSRAPERLLMLVGMGGFLIMALAIPEAFFRDGVALGLGYLIVVLVHAWLYQRVNRNIARVVPFNLAAAVLVIAAGIVKGPAGYVLWAVALAIPALSPLVVHPRGRFSISPSHFTERHGALVIIVLGESVVDIGIGAEGHDVTVSLVLSAVLGLALTAALWWAYFGAADDERAERSMTAADPAVRPALALAAYFYAYIPMLLGIVAAGLGGQAGHRAHREHTARPGRAWPWAAASRCSWRAARRSGTRCGSAPSGTGWARRRCRAGRLGGRGDAERRGRDGAADRHRGGGAGARAARTAPDTVEA